GLAAFEHGEPHGLVRDRPQHERLHQGRLAPELLVHLQRELDAGLETHDLVRAGADWRFLEPLVADPFDVFLGHDPGGAGSGTGVNVMKSGHGRLRRKRTRSGSTMSTEATCSFSVLADAP